MLTVLNKCFFIFLIMFLAGSIPTSAAELPSLSTATCHPTPDPTLSQYLIGYGSLIQSASKNSTYSGTGNNLPILVSGFKRGWFAEGASIGFSTTFLGVVKDYQFKFNGVMFKVPSTQAIMQYDAREAFYCRTLVSSTDIQMLNHSAIPKGQFWIYIPEKTAIKKPNARFPIVQSYVDVFLSGCFEIQEKYHLENFAADCVATTYDWSPHWVNDRIYPRRPFVNQPNAKQIDKLLSDKLPKIFNSIKIE